MSFVHRLIEETLDKTFAVRKWQLFLQRSAILATVICGLVLLLGAAMAAGLFAGPGWLAVCFSLLVLGGFFVWLIVGMISQEQTEDSTSLAAAVE